MNRRRLGLLSIRVSGSPLDEALFMSPGLMNKASSSNSTHAHLSQVSTPPLIVLVSSRALRANCGTQMMVDRSPQIAQVPQSQCNPAPHELL
jgi:hypothetical protein